MKTHWNLSDDRNRPNSITLQSDPMGMVLSLPFMLSNAEAEQWQMTGRREILQAIADEGERQLADHATIIEAAQAASAVADRKATAESCRHKIAELRHEAEAAALKGNEINIDAAVKKISAEQLKLSAIENIIPTLEKTAATAAEKAATAVRSANATALIYKQLQSERAALIAELTAAVQEKVQRLAVVEHQMTVAMLDAASIKSGMNRKYVPIVASTSPPITVKS